MGTKLAPLAADAAAPEELQVCVLIMMKSAEILVLTAAASAANLWLFDNSKSDLLVTVKSQQK
jgi:hypothetical protein